MSVQRVLQSVSLLFFFYPYNIYNTTIAKHSLEGVFVFLIKKSSYGAIFSKSSRLWDFLSLLIGHKKSTSKERRAGVRINVTEQFQKLHK